MIKIASGDIFFLISLVASPTYGMNIFEAATIGDTERVEELIAAGIDVNQQDNNGNTPLHKAARRGRHAIVETLIANKADVNKQNICGETPLHKAARHGKLKAVKILIAHGADVNRQHNGGWTPLHEAAYNGKLRVVQTLIAHNSDVDACACNCGTPLREAAGQGHLKVVKTLIVHNANVNKRDCCGLPPLWSAKLFQRQAVVDLINRVNAATDALPAQLLALIEAGHQRLGAQSPAQQVIQDSQKEVAKIIVKYVRQVALEDAVYQQNQ